MIVHREKLPSLCHQLLAGRFLLGIGKGRGTRLYSFDTKSRRVSPAQVSTRKLLKLSLSYDSNRFVVADNVLRELTGTVTEDGVFVDTGPNDVTQFKHNTVAHVRHIVGDKVLLSSPNSSDYYLFDVPTGKIKPLHMLSASRNNFGLATSPLATRYVEATTSHRLVFGYSSNPYEQNDTRIPFEHEWAVPPFNVRANENKRFSSVTHKTLPLIAFDAIRWVGEDVLFIPAHNVLFRITLASDRVADSRFVLYKNTHISHMNPSSDGKRAACLLYNRLRIETFDRKMPAIPIKLPFSPSLPRAFWLADNQRVVVADSRGNYVEVFVGDGGIPDTHMLIAANGRGKDREVARAMASDVYNDRFVD